MTRDARPERALDDRLRQRRRAFHDEAMRAATQAVATAHRRLRRTRGTLRA